MIFGDSTGVVLGGCWVECLCRHDVFPFPRGDIRGGGASVGVGVGVGVGAGVGAGTV